jgi:hypothetical protein
VVYQKLISLFAKEPDLKDMLVHENVEVKRLKGGSNSKLKVVKLKLLTKCPILNNYHRNYISLC